MQKKGIQIHCLDSRLIYPLYGVWTPTTQEYLSLISNYVQQSKNKYKRMNSLVDLGCGTGVLPIVLSENGGYEGKIYSIDS
jgi:ribosomal protein L11 methylase PrmA